MSAMLPQIRSHRAMAAALRDAAEKAESDIVDRMLTGMARAHEASADALEAGERALQSRIYEIPARGH